MAPGPGTPEPPPANVPPPRAGSPTHRGDGTSDGGRGGSGGSVGSGSGAATTKQASGKPSSELGFSKVAAGAGAAVVTAVLGSFLGAVGTILGAALGSIITALVTTLFQRSIERTHAQVADRSQKLRERRGTPRSPGAAVWQAAARDGGIGAAGPDGQKTVRIDPTAVGVVAAPGGKRSRFRMTRKQVIVSATAAVLTFVLALFLVTGIEWIKGSTITGGGSGTSVGNVVSGAPAQQPRTGDDQSGGSTSTSETSTTSPNDSNSDRTGQSTSTSENGNGSSGSTSPSDPLGGLTGILPSQSNDSGQLQSGPGSSANTGNSGGGANSSN